LARITVYCSDAQEMKIKKIARELGLSASKLMLKGLPFWLSKKGMIKEAEKLNALMEEREAKELERETGDYLGSFDKHIDKRNRIETAYKNKQISREERDMLRKIADINFSTTQRNKRIRLGIATKEDRKIAFVKKRGLKVGKNGKIKKKKHS
jgi:hypothetical protein